MGKRLILRLWLQSTGDKTEVKTSFGNVKVVTTRFDRLVYAVPRKKYTRNHPYPSNTQRIKVLPREKAAIIMLRRHGYPMNMISRFLGRSTSFIYRTLRTAIMRLSIRNIDMRKLPSATRISLSGKRWRNFKKYMVGWENFIFGEGEKPP